MTLGIHWHLMFRTANKVSFAKCMSRVLPILVEQHEVSDGEPYWKCPELWECVVTTSIPVGSVAEQIGASLMIAQRLASGWSVVGSPSSGSAEGFGGVFSLGHNNGASKVLGLEWASFYFRPLPLNTTVNTPHHDPVVSEEL